MTRRPLAALALTLVVSTTAAVASAESPPPFTKSVPLDHSTATLTVDFHDDQPTMVPCTPEQAASIAARAAERLEELLPVLYARMLAKKLPEGSDVQVLLDAACYDGGIMGLAGYGRGEEKIRLAYEESKDGEEWGPLRRPTIVITDPALKEETPENSQ